MGTMGTSHWPLMDAEEARSVRPGEPSDEDLRRQGRNPAPSVLLRILGAVLGLVAFALLLGLIFFVLR